MGILNMRERIKLIGGTLSINSIDGQGTIVNVKVPAHKKEQEGYPLSDH